MLEEKNEEDKTDNFVLSFFSYPVNSEPTQVKGKLILKSLQVVVAPGQRDECQLNYIYDCKFTCNRII